MLRSRFHLESGRAGARGTARVRLSGPVDADTVGQFEALGVHRLVLLRDFGDMAGSPDADKRGQFLRHMEDTAKSLGI